MSAERIRFWVVSPNVMNDESSVSAWRNASIEAHAAFMGYGPSVKKHGGSGYKFAHDVKDGDRVLLARRHNLSPEIVGFGVVRGQYKKKLHGIKLPEPPGAMRLMSPFVPRSRAPKSVPLLAAIGQTRALAELHPEADSAHRKLCDWMDRELKKQHNSSRSARTKKHALGKAGKPQPRGHHPKIGADYTVRIKAQVKKARQIEAKLVKKYFDWFDGTYRKESQLRCEVKCSGHFTCDLYDWGRRNLIEAKASVRREDLRMAVGQLMDYAYLTRKRFKNSHRAILVPERPSRELADWLKAIDIDVIWPSGRHFCDSANGQFI